MSVVSLLLLTGVLGGDTYRTKGYQNKHDRYRGYDSRTPSPTPSDEELCGCYNFQLVEPVINYVNETCYNYKIEKISDNNYCKPIEYMLLGTGDLIECGLNSSDIDSILFHRHSKSRSKCPETDTIFDNEINGSPFIKLKISSYKSHKYGKDHRFHSGISGSSDDQVSDIEFSMCFDPLIVGGVQEYGEVVFKTAAGKYMCEAHNLLPDFCYESEDDIYTTMDIEEELSSTIFDEFPVMTTPNPTTNPTTSRPTLAPTYMACDTDDALNIAFVLDESGSVDIDEWGIIIQFVERLITFDVSPVSYVSLFEFASLANYRQFLKWTGPKSITEQTMINALYTNPYNPSGQTETWDAVNRVLDNFHDYKQNCDDECYQRSDILFLVTDGEPTGNTVCPDMIPRMQSSNVDIVVILIDPNGDIDETKVSCLDVQNSGMDIIKLPSFDSDDFNAIEARIRDKICNGENPEFNGERPVYNPWIYENGTIGLGPIPTRSGGGLGGAADPARNNGEFDNQGMNKNANNKKTQNGSMWLTIVGFLAVFLGIIGYLMCRTAKKNTIDNVADINIQDKDNQVYGTDIAQPYEGDGNATIIV